jgi:hypothetical protein
MTMVQKWMLTLLGLAALATLATAGMAARVPDRPRRDAPSPAAVVTAFVRTSVVAPVLAMEGALARANATVPSYNPPPLANPGLAQELAVRALVLLNASAQLTIQTPPLLDPLVTRQLDRLLEDLTTCSAQLALLLDDTATALVQPAQPDQVLSQGYWPGVHRALTLLRRAEGWLETVDREIGAHVRLPGFERGTSLELQINLR